ncbi:hypothetical protein [Chromobacterium phragmitis]|uniref:hypothetical protein n=1 Tax=Chromobacterium phragmitis TaxID=2202141 RepID=UPI0011AE17BE|nr:hypothetical protein [Chromobacterium phragmitis]
MSKEKSSDGTPHRWWEAYLVRYFFGFIVGSICVFIIIENKIDVSSFDIQNLKSILKEGQSWQLVMLCFLGFVYCYFASMPIAVMHFGRFGAWNIERLSRYFWLGLVLNLVNCFCVSKGIFFGLHDSFVMVLLLLSLVLMVFWYVKKDGKVVDGVGYKFSALFAMLFSFVMFSVSYLFSDLSVWSFVVMPALWIGFFQYVIIFRIWSAAGRRELYHSYKMLTRARGMEGARDVRDTYSHLREHSNAVFIVVVEISVLAFLLKNMPRLEKVEGVSGGVFIACVIIWLVPSLFLWSAANRFETEFKRYPAAFLGKYNGTRDGS